MAPIYPVLVMNIIQEKVLTTPECSWKYVYIGRSFLDSEDVFIPTSDINKDLDSKDLDSRN